jgi:hypothetical protein
MIGTAGRKARRPPRQAADSRSRGASSFATGAATFTVGKVTMPPFFLITALSTIIGVGLAASPLQAANIDSGLWSKPDLLFVLSQEELAVTWQQLTAEFKRTRGFFIEDDLLYIEGRDGTPDRNASEHFGDRKTEVELWTDPSSTRPGFGTE